MGLVFDKEKKYLLEVDRDGHHLVFTATQVEIVGSLITFIDKYNKQLIFPIEALQQAKEITEGEHK